MLTFMFWATHTHTTIKKMHSFTLNISFKWAYRKVYKYCMNLGFIVRNLATQNSTLKAWWNNLHDIYSVRDIVWYSVLSSNGGGSYFAYLNQIVSD